MSGKRLWRCGLVLAAVAAIMFSAGCASTKKALRELTKEDRLDKFREQQQAKEAFEEKSLKQLPKIAESDHEALGDLYLRQGKMQLAFLQYDKALRADPERFELHCKKGLVYLRQGLNKEAVGEFEAVLARRPDHARAHAGMGEALFKLHEIPEARQHLGKALAGDPKLWQAHNLLGVIYNYENQPQKAIGEFQAALSVEPDLGALHNNLGIARAMTGDWANAVQAFRQAVDLDRASPKFCNNLGFALGKLGRYSEALQAFKMAGDEAQAYNNLGCLYLEGRKYGDAIDCYQKAIELRSNFYARAGENLENAKRLVASDLYASPVHDLAPPEAAVSSRAGSP